MMCHFRQIRVCSVLPSQVNGFEDEELLVFVKILNFEDEICPSMLFTTFMPFFYIFIYNIFLFYSFPDSWLYKIHDPPKLSAYTYLPSKALLLMHNLKF